MAAPSFGSQDIAQNKLTGGIGYLLPFVPFFACPKSAFGKYCANEGLLFWLVMLVIRVVFGIASFVLGWVPPIRWLLDFVGFWGMMAVFMLEVYYTFVAMVRGQAKEIPVIGGITLIK